MKKIFIVLIAFLLVFAACEEEKADNGNSDVIGIWTGSYTNTTGDFSSTITLDIVDGTWVLIENIEGSNSGSTYNGTWTRDANTLQFRIEKNNNFANASLSEGKLFFKWTYWQTTRNYTLTKSGSSGGTGGTTLKINNQSFTEITDVIWQNVSFANNQYENSIKSSTNVTNTVQAGAGYIFFKRKSNPITARTRDLVVVENGENIEFTFTDNTVIVEVNNATNSGTLGALQSTVVWWDDAEGEMQPYYEARSFVGYYRTYTDLDGSSSSTFYDFHSPKNGNKSIAIGGTPTAKLHLKINLTRNAKLSFWYSNMWYSSTGAMFSINGEEMRKWTTDVNWSFIEFDLEPGINDLIWEKKDGRSGSYGYYLSLDDILIYYTE
jgi:hypothetical protein